MKGKVVGNTVLVEEVLPEGAEVEVRLDDGFVPDEETARDVRTPGVRRVFLRTEHVLYYRVNAKAGFIEILRSWHMSRGQARSCEWPSPPGR